VRAWLPGRAALAVAALMAAVGIGHLLAQAHFIFLGIGAEMHFYQCDVQQNRRDVRRVLMDLEPNATLLFVGHFGPVTREAVEAHFRE